MHFRSMILFCCLFGLAMLGVAQAAPAAGDDAKLLANASPVTTVLAASFLPPPPPPPTPSCASICRVRYASCIDAGTNPSVCAGKYNYCTLNCSDPPIFVQ